MKDAQDKYTQDMFEAVYHLKAAVAKMQDAIDYREKERLVAQIKLNEENDK